MSSLEQVRFEKEPLHVMEQNTCKEKILQIQKQSGSGESYGSSGQDNNFTPPGNVLHEYASSDCDVQGLTHLCEESVIKTPEETYIDTGGPF